MPFTPPTWTNGSTPLNATNMTSISQQYTEATNSLEQDLLTAFVLAGLVASKDASVATKLNVSAGTAFPQQADSTLRRRALAATSFTTATPSTTYFLDLNPDGTWSWGTSHSAQANYLPIAQVTTDGSGNIASVTDKRTTTTTLLSGQVGSALALPVVSSLQAQPPQAGQYAGQIVGGVTSAAGLIVGSPDGALRFDGSSGYISAPATGLPTGNGAFSIECWYQASAYQMSGTGIIASFGGGTGVTSGAPSIYTDTTDKLYAGVNNGAALIGSTTTFALNVPHHLVHTYDGTTMRFYVDGVLQGTATPPGGLSIPASGGAVGIATWPTLTSGWFCTGTIDEVAFYNAALSAGQVTTHYTRGTTGPSGATTYAATILAEPSLLRYYRLDDTPARGRANQAIAEHDPVIASDGSINPVAVASVGGQPTAGGFGVPVIVGSVYRAHVTSTGSQTLLTLTTPPPGLYRVSASIEYGNSSTQAPTLTISIPGISTAGVNVNPFIAKSGTTVAALDGTSTTLSPGFTFGTIPVTVAGQGTITISYNDPAGAPNDYVSVVIERLG